MKNIACAALTVAVLVSSVGGAMAQPYQGQPYQGGENRYQQQQQQRHYQEVQQHREWRQGEAMRHEDWERGRRFDYREYGLRAPPPGYEWREVGGAFILGAIATGIIANILLQPPQ